MPNLYTEIQIEAPKAQVWQALIHKEDWRWWNTFLFDCDPNRPFIPGREVSLALCRLEGEEETSLRPRVTLVQPEHCLRWVSRIPGIRSEHVFELQELGPNRTQYIHRERLSGLLAGVFLPFIRQDEKQGTYRMARQLKRYVEQGYRPRPRTYERRYY